ncbi:peptide-methionine (S)-S-oxide reductase MsrA [Pararhizobium haloflavum]|uniref:peptide-methionine (S)-S-oxide reductase MsrA n=1 Tax=Pararhizobium haloflavum TaxID=2037914 RepID=UPI000C1882E7|nr:peptide-methionine (S)-S-oxide reductase MsrA [Pararhizobium haloflavum]
MRSAGLAILLLSSLTVVQPAGAQDAKSTAIFAGGCFWCVEADFDKVKGVTDTVSGYIGGNNDNPTYQDHTAAGHREAVKITFDPAQTDYATLLETFWRTVDPTDGGGQFCDRGHSYTTAVYAVDAQQAATAEQSRAAAEKALGDDIVTEIVSGETFWPAETYHQDYYKKNPVRYRFYRQACGRDAQIERLWGDAAMMGVAAK